MRGFSLLELLFVIAIMAMLSLMLIPNISSSLETRGIENSAREILTAMQQAKLQAVKTRQNHRVHFENVNGQWRFSLEREDSSGEWAMIPGYVKKTVPTKFEVTVNLPEETLSVVFSPLGLIDNYDVSRSSIRLKSDKLESYNQPDLRIVTVLAGGSIRYQKTES